MAPLRAEGAPQADAFPRDHRPWGWYESRACCDRFQVKRIVVRPGAALSRQSHHHRSEQWIVVEVQTGAYLGQDDILQFEDLHRRD